MTVDRTPLASSAGERVRPGEHPVEVSGRAVESSGCVLEGSGRVAEGSGRVAEGSGRADGAPVPRTGRNRPRGVRGPRGVRSLPRYARRTANAAAGAPMRSQFAALCAENCERGAAARRGR